MRQHKGTGTCHICGTVGPLTYEHVPPRAAFNSERTMVVSGERALHYVPGTPQYGRYEQRGAGGYTLCGQCNNSTGDWYASDFAQWCYQGRDVLIRSGGRPSLIYIHYIHPLRVLKQIVTMMFSVNGDKFRLHNEELVRFVLNREARYLSPGYRFYAYYSSEGVGRAIGTSGLLNVETGRKSIMSEINHPPFGYVMTLNSSPPDKRLYDISHFARYDYDEWAVTPLHLPVLPTHMPFPGDYRTMDQINHEYADVVAFDRGLQRGVPIMLPTG